MRGMGDRSLLLPSLISFNPHCPMPEKTIFQKIANREIPGDIVYEDDLCLCFRDIAPQAPVHLLLVPRKLIVRIGEADPVDQDLLGHLLTRVRIIAEQEGLAEDGFRVVINNGKNGGEAVPHLHLHILAGRPLEWPPG